MNYEEFKNPGKLYRNAPFWSWNDKLDKDELKRQIDEMAKQGWGGYFMHSRVGLVTEYLSDEWMDMIITCAEKARTTNTCAWLYDEDKWPSGIAGGKIPEKEEYRSRALLLLKKNEVTKNDTVIKEHKYKNQKYVICRRISEFGDPWYNGACYVDLMNPKTVKTFIESTHEKYKEYCGNYFGKEIPGIFTDEPGYLREKDYNSPVLPWSEYLPDFFKARKGYSIEDKLEELFFDIGDYKKTRYDFFESASTLFLESYTKQYYEWCDENNLIMTGHYMAEDSLTYQLEWIGSAMPHYEYMHWPGIDKLGRHLEQVVTVKQLTSVVEQVGKERAFCEAFADTGQQVNLFYRKWITDWMAVLGINFINSHLSLYSMRGERKRDCPPNLFYQQPWWKHEKYLSDYTARLCYLGTLGEKEVDILVLHPLSSVWCEYSPLHKRDRLAMEKGYYDNHFESLSKKLVAEKIEFHYGDEKIISKHGRIENGKFFIGKSSYKTIIMPPSLNINSNVNDKIIEFIECCSDSNVIVIGKIPTRIDGKKEEISWIDKSIKVNTEDEAINILKKYYSNSIKIIDKLTKENAQKVICSIRRLQDEELILIANTDDKKEIDIDIIIHGYKKVGILDLVTGEVNGIDAEYLDKKTKVSAKLYPAGSLYLIYGDENIKLKKKPLYVQSGVCFFDKYKTKKIIKKFDITTTNKNVLPLRNVNLKINKENSLNNQHISKVWHENFYNLRNGTAFRCEYSFEVINIPKGDVFVALEMAENLKSIVFNGSIVNPLKKRGELGAFDADKSWMDISFTKVPLDGLLRKGENKLIIEGDKINNITGPWTHEPVKDHLKHIPTEIETAYIVGDFSVVNENNEKFYIDEKNEKIACNNIVNSGYPFYTGDVKYKCLLDNSEIKSNTLLKINNVEAASVEVFVNGRSVGIRCWEPYIFDIVKVSKDVEINLVEIIATNDLFNLMGPNWIAGIKDYKRDLIPYTFVDFKNFTKKYSFFDFGIDSISLIDV